VFEIPEIKEIKPDISKGLYRIDHDAYHQGAGLSSTTVKKAVGSYAKFMEPRQEKDCFNFGRTLNMAVLEPHLFNRHYVRAPVIQGHKNSNAYKAEISSFREENQGKEIIEHDDYEAMMNMVASVLGHPDFDVKGYQPEIMAVTRCKETGLLLKCKADQFSGYVNDLKTTSVSVAPHEFRHEIRKWGYHVSLAFYQDIIADVIGMPPTMKITAVEKKAPYDCAVFVLSDSILEEGRKIYKACLRRIKKWQEMGAQNAVGADYCKYVLEADAAMRYNTEAILSYLEGNA